MSAEDSGMPSVILNAVCAACSRKSKLYREAAFSCLQQVSISLLYPDLYVKLKFVASGYSKAFYCLWTRLFFDKRIFSC